MNYNDVFKNVKKINGAPQYRVQARGKRGEIYLYGVIGETWFAEGITATKFKDDLKKMGDVSAIDVRINSEGGDVWDGRVMYNLLREHPAKKVVHVDGLAGSIASLIAMAGDEIHMGDGSFFMIHNAWGIAVGNAKEFRARADVMDSVSQTMRETYMSRTGQSSEKIASLMDDESWINATEAKELGFADFIVEDAKVAACVYVPELYSKLPEPLLKNRKAASNVLEQMAALIAK